MQIEDVSQQKDNDQWLFEEVLGKLVMTLKSFVSYHYRFINIKPDTPINVYIWFCLNTAKSKFSLVSPVADW